MSNNKPILKDLLKVMQMLDLGVEGPVSSTSAFGANIYIRTSNEKTSLTCVYVTQSEEEGAPSLDEVMDLAYTVFAGHPDTVVKHKHDDSQFLIEKKLEFNWKAREKIIQTLERELIEFVKDPECQEPPSFREHGYSVHLYDFDSSDTVVTQLSIAGDDTEVIYSLLHSVMDLREVDIPYMARVRRLGRTEVYEGDLAFKRSVNPPDEEDEEIDVLAEAIKDFDRSEKLKEDSRKRELERAIDTIIERTFPNHSRNTLHRNR